VASDHHRKQQNSRDRLTIIFVKQNLSREKKRLKRKEKFGEIAATR